MSQTTETEAVFGYLFHNGERESLERLREELERSEFSRNDHFQNPVYDFEGSRIVIYPQSGYVRLLQREGSYPDTDLYSLYRIEDEFDLKSQSLKPVGEGPEREKFKSWT